MINSAFLTAANSTPQFLITIITVTFNAESDIEKTIKSVISQNFKDLQYIIIDGNSTDNTCHIIKQYEQNISYWISEADKGIYDAMNKGINKAKGKYYLFLNAGDTLNSGVLDKISRALEDEPKLIYGNFYHEGNKRLYWGPFDRYRLCFRTIPHPASFFHHSLFKQYGLYNTNYPIASDYEFFLRIFKLLHFKETRYINLTISNFKAGGISSFSSDPLFFEHKIQLLQQWTNMDLMKFYKSGILFFDIMQFLNQQKFIIWYEATELNKLELFKKNIEQINSYRNTNNKAILTINYSTHKKDISKKINSIYSENSTNYWHVVFSNNKNKINKIISTGVKRNNIVFYRPFIFSRNFIQTIKNHQIEKLVVFGTGELAINVIQVIQESTSNNIDLFFDNDPLKSGKSLNRIPIVYPDKKYLSDSSIIVIASQWQLEIRQQLLQMGVHNNQIIDTCY